MTKTPTIGRIARIGSSDEQHDGEDAKSRAITTSDDDDMSTMYATSLAPGPPKAIPGAGPELGLWRLPAASVGPSCALPPLRPSARVRTA